MVSARRGNNPSNLRPLSLKPITKDYAAAYLKRADWHVVLVLHHDLYPNALPEKGPRILRGWQNAFTHQWNCAF